MNERMSPGPGPHRHGRAPWRGSAGLTQACWREFWQRKPVEDVIRASKSPLRWLTRRHLVVASLAAMIGAGILDSAPEAVKEHGVRNTVFGLFVAAVAICAAALCFAELASTIPVSGSTYTYTYTTFNQALAWMVGFILLLEYSVGAFVIAQSWSRSMTGQQDPPFLLAVVLVLACAGLLAMIEWKGVWGLLTGLVAASVLVKVGGMIFVSVVGFAKDQSPDGSCTEQPLELSKVVLAFSLLYFSFIGFDAPSTAAEDSRYPQRDLARSIFWSLAIVSVLYFGFTMSGGGCGLPQYSWVTGWSRMLGLPAGVLVFLYGQGRILRAVIRDGLFGDWLRRKYDEKPAAPQVDEPKLRWESVVAGVASSALSGLLILAGVYGDRLTKFVNVATGVAFAVVAVGTMVLRIRRPDLPRTFKAPWLYVAGPIAVAASVVLIYNTVEILHIFAVWFGAGAALYLIVLVTRIAAGPKG